MVDLNYTDKNGVDVGVIKGYNLDLAYGRDENNFLLELPLKETELTSRCIIYMEGTDIGGIIDKPGVSTASKRIRFKGRTWHGIMAGHVLCPDPGVDFLVFDGEANEVIREMIDMVGLTDIFTVSTQDSGIEIDNYLCRYGDLYHSIVDMLFQATGKLHMEYKDKHVELSAVPYIDYSQNEEWDASQKDFNADRDDRPVNHIVCLGSGDLSNRYVIHLFADENGGLQAYTSSNNPYKDSDYILDRSGQQLFGMDEVTYVFDYANAKDTWNYMMLHEKPADFDKNFGRYYVLNENGTKYIPLEADKATIYTLLPSQPVDWSTKCDEYYYRYVTDEEVSYRHVSWDKTNKYTLLSAQPADWAEEYGGYYYLDNGNYKAVPGDEKVIYKAVADATAKNGWSKNYGNYYLRTWDGTQYVYTRVAGVTKYKYEVQTKKPSDWSKNYSNYYKKKAEGSGYEKVTATSAGKAPSWKKKKYYTRYSYTKAPKFKSKNTYYIMETHEVAPAWKASTYYYATSVKVAPGFEANKYYYATEVTYNPKWAAGMYYELFIDHYADLVANAIVKFKEYYDCDSIKIELNPGNEYDIGDVVGASENVTGLSVWQPITKKIVKINQNKKTISYEVGGK